MPGVTWMSVAGAVVTVAASALVWAVLFAAAVWLFRAAFGRRHCSGCHCRPPAEPADLPHDIPGFEREADRLAYGPVAVLSNDGLNFEQEQLDYLREWRRGH